MSGIPSIIHRVPTYLGAQLMGGSIGQTNRALLQLQVQLASGRAINRPSDDALGASRIGVLDDAIERRDQRLRNLSHADAVLNNVDAGIAAATDLVIEAKSIALSQIGVGSDAATREAQAAVIDAMLLEMANVANRRYQDLHLFGGDRTRSEPYVEHLGGFRYVGAGDGLEADLGVARALTITASGQDVFGARSARVAGDRDLDPDVTAATRLADLNGAGGAGVRLGSITVNVNGTDLNVDLAGADRVESVTAALASAIQTIDAGAVVQIDAAGQAIEIIPSGGTTVTVGDVTGGFTAADLGIDATFTGPGGGVGAALDARMTPRTALAALDGVTVPLGTIRVENAGRVRDLDLSGAETVQDVMNLVAGLDIGVRVEIAADGDRLNVVNELSGASMSIGEVGGGTTATELGLRSLAAGTALADFNDGRGVEIRSGSVDPVSGLPDPAADLDFRVTVKDGRTFDVDLAGAETVQDVLDLVNAAAATAGLGVPAEFQAHLAADGNGIALTDLTVGATTSVTALNDSAAPEQLGLLGSTTGATLTGADRARVAVDSVFSSLIALRDALRADDEHGITLAGEGLEADLDRLALARAATGVKSRRVLDATTREEDLRIQETALRSQVQDLDFTEAAVRFATLQQQLQAALTTTSRVQSLTLLDFLG